MDFKTARDNFGKLVGENFVVVQVNIRNQDPTRQFLLQNTEIIFDSLRCNNTVAANLKEQRVGILENKSLQSEIESKKLELSQLNIQLDQLKKEEQKSKQENGGQSKFVDKIRSQAKKFGELRAEIEKLTKRVPSADEV